MGSSSPLGGYAAPVAAIVAVAIVGAYVISLFTPTMDPQARTQLQDAAFIALGAVFGSAVAVNGYKAPLNAAHLRLDKLQAAVTATAARTINPDTASVVAAILEDNGDAPHLPPVAPSAGAPG